VEANAPCSILWRVVARGGDDHFVSTGLQTHADGDKGMQVAQGADVVRTIRRPVCLTFGLLSERLSQIGTRYYVRQMTDANHHVARLLDVSAMQLHKQSNPRWP